MNLRHGMALVLARAFGIGFVGMILGYLFAVIGNASHPDGHFLFVHRVGLPEWNAFHLIAYFSALLGGGFGAVIGAISAAAELIAAAAGRNQSGEVKANVQSPPAQPR